MNHGEGETIGMNFELEAVIFVQFSGKLNFVLINFVDSIQT